MQEVAIRAYRTADLEALQSLTMESFAGVTLEQNIEESLGLLNGHDWRWRKARHIDDDVAANPSGIFVAESRERLVGYITTRVERETGKGRIPNLAVAAEFRGQGFVQGETRDLTFTGNVIRDTRKEGDRKQTVGVRIDERAGAVTLEKNVIEADTRVDDRRPGKR